MSSPTRMPGGLNDHASANSGWGKFYPQLDPLRYTRYVNDFHTYTAGEWTVTETQAGSTQGITSTAGHGGILALVNTDTDNDVNQIQLAAETFKFASGRKAWMRARFKLSDATQSDALIGLAITDTSLLASLPSDGVFFYKADDAASLTFQVRKDGTASSQTIGTMADDTYVVVGLYYDGKTTFTTFLNDVEVASPVTVTTNMPDDEELTVSIAVQAGDANADTMSVDYIEVVMER